MIAAPISAVSAYGDSDDIGEVVVLGARQPRFQFRPSPLAPHDREDLCLIFSCRPVTLRSSLSVYVWLPDAENPRDVHHETSKGRHKNSHNNFSVPLLHSGRPEDSSIIINHTTLPSSIDHPAAAGA